jgi:trk system potassium uptake protein TrkA
MAATEFIVIGLGRFGGGLAETLVGMGHEVLGVDADPKLVQSFSGTLTHVVEADATNEQAMRQLGAQDFQTAVVSIGTEIEASILTTSILADLQIPRIVAKAVSQAHGRILERVGAHRVVFPERDMGIRVGHSLAGSILDYFELDPGFAIVETSAPKALVGKTLAQAEVRKRYGITVVCVKPQGGAFTYATPDTVVNEGDIIVVAAEKRRAEAFGELA